MSAIRLPAAANGMTTASMSQKSTLGVGMGNVFKTLRSVSTLLSLFVG